MNLLCIAHALMLAAVLVMAMACMALWSNPWLAALIAVALPVASRLDGWHALREWGRKRGC